MKTFFLALLLMLSASSFATAESEAPRKAEVGQVFTSGPARTALLELYTSEGCSSCPPAEAWLGRLAAHPRLWQDFVPLSFHVDYWDGLGWRDRFASPAATERQRGYAAAWGNGSVYTPGLVLDGREWRQWSGDQAGEFPPSARSENAGVLRAAIVGGKTVEVSHQSTDRRTARRHVTVALLGFGLNSQVQAGENRGRSLDHDFVVLAWNTAEMNAGEHGESATLKLPGTTAEAKRLALAVWVQDPGQGSVLQATGGWLTAADKPSR